MQNKSLLYWILNKDKQPLYINASNNVEAGAGVTKTTGEPANLEASPDGWNSTLVKWGRNNKYLGLFREFSVPLNFVKDGAKILRDAFFKVGMEAVYYLSISKLDRTTFPDKYENWYTGEFDFSKYIQTDTGVRIDIMEGGLSKLLKAYESTTYEIPVNTDTEKFSLYLDGLTFENKISYTIFEDQDIFGEFYYIGAGVITNEGTSQGIIAQDSQYSSTTQAGENFFIHSLTKTTNVHLKGSLNIKVNQTGNIKILFKKCFPFQNIPTTIIDYVIHNANHNAGTNFTVDFDLIIPLLPNQFITFRAFPNAVSTAANWFTIQKGSFDLKYNVRFDGTLCECLTWMRLFEKVTEKLTNGKYGCRSNFLTSLTGTQAVTSGQAIRKYQPLTDKQVIKTSIADFFKACQRWGVGLGIENNQLIIEPHSYFFGSKTAIALGEIKDLEIEVATDLEINTIKAGYTNQTYDNVNGKDEFNVTQQRTTPHTRIVKELDLICPYRADMFGIELTRLKLFGKDTTDNQADNDTFIINVVKGTNYDLYRGTFQAQINTGQYFLLIPNTEALFVVGQKITFSAGTFTILNISFIIAGYAYLQVLEPLTAASYNQAISTYDANVYKLNRPAYSAITGLIQPSEAFNIELSPTKSLLNNGAYIHSLMDLQDMNKLVYQSGEKNSLLYRTLTGVTTTENADIPINNLPAKLFKPYYFKFKTEVPVNLQDTMRLTPYDLVSFTYRGNLYKGFIWANGAAPAKMDAQEWTLLSAPDNDLTKLI